MKNDNSLYLNERTFTAAQAALKSASHANLFIHKFIAAQAALKFTTLDPEVMEFVYCRTGSFVVAFLLIIKQKDIVPTHHNCYSL